MQLQKNSIIKLEITALSSDGNGIGKHEGMAVFVAFCAPGDVLMVRIAKLAKSHAFGIIEKIISPSPHRITPSCEIFGKCGGCAFAHINYTQELLQKQNFVKDAFNRIGNLQIETLPIVPSPNEFAYRNKVQYPLCQNEKTNEIKAGFYAARSHRVIPCDNCVLQPQILNDITHYTCKLLTHFNISIYSEKNINGLIRHIYLRHAVKTGDVMLCLVINGKTLPHEKEICENLTQKFAQLSTIVLNINMQNTNVILGKINKTLYGSGVLADELCEIPVNLSPLTFYQVNTKGAQLLYETVIEFANIKPHETLLDLYCGAGTIGLAINKKTPCKALIGVEIVEDAIKSARENAENANAVNAQFFCADAANAADKLASENYKPDVVILDPPRKGCDELTLNSIIKMAPSRIVMVSCNAATAARDVKFIAENGYKVSAVKPVDLFPKTKHVECVVLMTFCGNGKKS